MMYRSFIEIDKKKVINNINNIKNISNKKISAVLKANAYGHGIKEMGTILEKYVDYFQVDSYQEFRQLRQITRKQIIITGVLSNQEIEFVSKNNGIPCINSLKQLHRTSKVAKNISKSIKIHLKLDCLIGRRGILPDQIKSACDIIKKARFLDFDGVYTHFTDVDSDDHVKKQVKCFKKCLKQIKQNKITRFKKHINSTSGMLIESKLSLKTDINRIGIGLYGLWHSGNMRHKYSKKLNLEPVLSWKSVVSQVKYLPKDHPVGYKLTFKTSKKTKVAVIPVGYSDGYDRKLSNRGHVLINKHLCPVIGLVSMNLFVVDISHVDHVKEGDAVTIIGFDGNNSICVDDLAKALNTINYEVLSRISPKIPRIVI